MAETTITTQIDENGISQELHSKLPTTTTNALSKKYEKIRPPNLHINNTKVESFEEDLNNTLGFSPDFDSVKSPNAPYNVDDNEDAYGDKTPTPPRCSTPPTGLVLSSSQNKIVKILHAYGLDQHVPLFIEQEVDLDLFLSLTDNDLTVIGVKDETDRILLLKVVEQVKMMNKLEC